MAANNFVRQGYLREIVTKIESLVEKHKKLHELLGSNDHVKDKRIARLKQKKQAVSALEAQINGLLNGLMVPMMFVDVNFHDLYPGPIDPVLYNHHDHRRRGAAIRDRTQFWTRLLVDRTRPWARLALR